MKGKLVHLKRIIQHSLQESIYLKKKKIHINKHAYILMCMFTFKTNCIFMRKFKTGKSNLIKPTVHEESRFL